jgi:hypothetical protein
MRAGLLRTRVDLIGSSPAAETSGAFDTGETVLATASVEWVEPTGGLMVSVAGGARSVDDVASHRIRLRARAVADANAVRVIRRRSDGMRLRVERWRALDQHRDTIEFLASAEGTV